MTTRDIAHTAALALAAGLAAPTLAQCPAWDTTIGNPGMGSGYVSPIHVFDDGAGEEIYAGGTFGSAGGAPGTAYLARYNPSTETWSAVDGGIQPNNTTFLTAMITADLGQGPTLFLGGAWGTAGNIPNSRNFVGYRNGQFFATGGNWALSTPDAVWSLAAWDDGSGMKVYVGGGFAQAGGVTANGIASYNGTSWAPLGSGIVAAANPSVNALKVFDDGSGPALYAAGRFSSVGGVAGTSLIGRWNGQTWTSVGGGLTPTNLNFGIDAMEIFDDGGGEALYVGGLAFTPPGQPTGVVAKWDGTSWTTVGQTMTGRVAAMTKFDDGAGEKLYIGGTMTSVGRIARLENGQWVMVDGGVDASVFGLRAIGDTLYMGGSFLTVNGLPSARIVARTSCGGGCYANCDGSTTEPALNVADFSCFLTEFAAGSAYANCDESTTEPTLNVADFSCFLTKFAAGCP